MSVYEPKVMLSRGKLVLAAIVVITGLGTFPVWWPRASSWIDSSITAMKKPADSLDGHDHGAEPAHGDSHAHDDSDSLELSKTARQNLGLTSEFLKPVELSTYKRRISIPAVVIARPGRTQIQVSTPLTGVVTHVHAVTGEAVTPGTLLFEIRLTHEELVTAQTEFLKTLGELDVERLEIARLEDIAGTGAISGRSLLEHKYSSDKLEASLRAQREALKLHGLSDRQVDAMMKERKLLRSLQIVAPDIDRHDHEQELRLSGRELTPVSLSRDLNAQDETGLHATENENQHANEHAHEARNSGDHPLVIGDLAVVKGQTVAAGDKLCVVSDFEHLFIEGMAFDQDGSAINAAAENNWSVTAMFPDEQRDEIVDNLKLAFVATEIDLESRSLSLFVDLPNVVVRDFRNEDGQRFVSWKFRTGQRLQLFVPVEEWTDQIVLPVDAVVDEGADCFVFQQNGKKFVRVGVHVKHRDQTHVVVANDGAIFPGDVVALRSAYQMQMAIKNKSGAGADPHAGHTH